MIRARGAYVVGVVKGVRLGSIARDGGHGRAVRGWIFHVLHHLF